MKEMNLRIDQPNSLFEKTATICNKYGADKFLNGSDPECHKGKEAFFAFFFLIGFRKLSQKDWWILQPESFPDLQLISFKEKAPFIEDVLQYELVTIPGHCKDIEDMTRIVEDKIKNKHYALNDRPCGLLVFTNNDNSRAFETELYQSLGAIHPFTEVWTTSFESTDKVNISKIIVSKVRPRPVIRFEFDFNDSSLYTYQKPPSCMEVIEEGGIRHLKIKREALTEIKKGAIKRRLNTG